MKGIEADVLSSRNLNCWKMLTKWHGFHGMFCSGSAAGSLKLSFTGCWLLNYLVPLEVQCRLHDVIDIQAGFAAGKANSIPGQDVNTCRIDSFQDVPVMAVQSWQREPHENHRVFPHARTQTLRWREKTTCLELFRSVRSMHCILEAKWEIIPTSTISGAIETSKNWVNSWVCCTMIPGNKGCLRSPAGRWSGDCLGSRLHHFDGAFWRGKMTLLHSKSLPWKTTMFNK